MAKSVFVVVRGFEKFKGRADVTHNSWFRCSNRLLEDPDFYEFTHAELLVWIYILSLASIKNSPEVEINFDRADRVCRLKKKDILSAIEKLQGIQIDPVDVTQTLRARNVDDTLTCATDRQTDKQTHTVASLPPIVLSWNEEIKNLKRVKKLNPKREKIIEKHSRDFIEAEWREIFRRADRSAFLCGGGSRGWRATFDWVLKNASRIDEGEFDGESASEQHAGSMRGA